MRKMSESEFAELMGKLETEFQKQYSLDTMGVMWHKLRFFPYEAVSCAVENLVMEEKFFPKYREIHGAIKRVMGSRGWKELKKEAVVEFECVYCEDTGIRLRRYRQDMAKDFYCDCETAKNLPKKHEWDTDSVWGWMTRNAVGTKDFPKLLNRAWKASGLNFDHIKAMGKHK